MTSDGYIIQYYRCPEKYIQLKLNGTLSGERGYFSFGSDIVCFGQLCGDLPSPTPNGGLANAMNCFSSESGVTSLPLDVSQVVDNLRYELYTNAAGKGISALGSVLSNLYYHVRPLLPVAVRKHLQKAWLTDWGKQHFPKWPVDSTVDRFFEQLLRLSLRAQDLERIPFIWFWPDGAPSCAIMTHDVETHIGRDHCSELMDLEDAHRMKSSFCVVPESRYEVTQEFLGSLRNRGFEILVHDLNHDGHLFRDRNEFLSRAEKINAYGKAFGAVGFRAAALYRNQQWFDALKFSYDMSVPNVGHLEAQRGGCCTVMPYFIGDILELPVTTTQDYALFNYLNIYSIDLWKRQIELIMEHHGLINFIVHPDYITKSRERNVYELLLKHLAQLQDERGLWIPTSGEVDRWWRQRAKMTIVESQHGVRIEGEGSERARVAYASEMNGKLVYTLQ
jgi:hypothetical protein